MMSNPLYIPFGLLLLGLVGAYEYNGWALSDYDEVKGVPRSVRDNPGAYRSHYSGRARYLGGK